MSHCFPSRCLTLLIFTCQLTSSLCLLSWSLSGSEQFALRYADGSQLYITEQVCVSGFSYQAFVDDIVESLLMYINIQKNINVLSFRAVVKSRMGRSFD